MIKVLKFEQNTAVQPDGQMSFYNIAVEFDTPNWAVDIKINDRKLGVLCIGDDVRVYDPDNDGRMVADNVVSFRKEAT